MSSEDERSLRQCLLPINMPAQSLLLFTGSRGEGKKDVELPDSIPVASELAITEQASWQLSANLAGRLGFPLISMDSHDELVVMLLGVARYNDVIQGDHMYRYGVAVRVLLEIINTDQKARFTPAEVAARVELGLSKASAQLSVHGYTGDLSRELPVWQSFDVHSYGEYMKSVNEIQTQVLHDVPRIKPVLLASTLARELKDQDDIAISGHRPWKFFSADRSTTRGAYADATGP